MMIDYKAVQWHFIDKLSNDSVESLLLQPITKFYLFTIELKLRDDFRRFRSKMCFRTFSTVPLNSPYMFGSVAVMYYLLTVHAGTLWCRV